MGQYFVIVNLDKRHATNIYKLGEAIYGMPLHSLLTQHYTVARSEHLNLNYDRSQVPKVRHQMQSPLLGRLPPEVVLEILVQADDFSTSVCLGLTCRLSYDIARRVMERQLNALTDWAGDRIAIFGDYARFDDLPDESIFKEDEKKLIKDYISLVNDAAVHLGDSNDLTGEDKPDMMNFQKIFIDDRCSEPKNPVAFCSDLHRMILGGQYKSRHDAYIFSSLSRNDHIGSTDTDDQVLRNLTTKEYIRGEAFYKAGLGSYWSLGDALVLRICWSSDPSASTPYERNITRGPWTGHRFDFVSFSAMSAGDDGAILPGWKDVTDELIDDALAMFECEGMQLSEQ